MTTRVKIIQDTNPENPREWDNLGAMVCFHDRYILGDKHGFSDPEDFREWIEENPSIILPLYLYDHSGITMNTGGFSDPWDSGQVGWIYVTLEKVREEYGKKRVSAQLRKRIVGHLENEVSVYDQYLTGDVWGFEVLEVKGIDDDAEPEEVLQDSCWGFFGSDPWKNGMVDHIGSEVLKQAEIVEAY